jgi:hypothetical protein
MQYFINEHKECRLIEFTIAEFVNNAGKIKTMFPVDVP